MRLTPTAHAPMRFLGTKTVWLILVAGYALHMVVVAQLVELLVVIQAVAGSSPVDHPKKRPGNRAFFHCRRSRGELRGDTP